MVCQGKAMEDITAGHMNISYDIVYFKGESSIVGI